MISRQSLGFDNFKPFDALLLGVWTLPVLMYNLRGLVSRILGEAFSEAFLPVFFIICILGSIKYIVTCTKWFDYLFFVACVGYFYFCYSFYSQNRFVLDEIEDIVLLQSLPLLFVGLCIDIDKSFNMLRSLSLLCILLKMLSVFVGGGIGDAGEASGDMESMSAAHNVLPYVLVLMWIALRNGVIKNWVIACFGVLFLLSLGNRGSLFGLLLFIVAYMLLFKKYIHSVRSRVFIGLSGVIGYLLMKPLMLLFMGLFASLGMSTRIFYKFLYDDIADANGRDVIQGIMMDYVHSGPFYGYGIAGDRSIGGGLTEWSHNCFIEMMMTFGQTPGIAIICIIFLLFFLALKKDLFSIQSQFLLLLICSCSILLFSNSFVQYPFFYLMLGYCINVLRNTPTSISK